MSSIDWAATWSTTSRLRHTQVLGTLSHDLPGSALKPFGGGEVALFDKWLS